MKLDFSPITWHSYNLAQAFGMQTPREVWTLRVLAWALPPDPVIVNIGAGTGTSSLAFAESRPDAMIYTVDISPGGPHGGMQNEANAFAGLDLTRPIQILSDSKEAGKSWQHGPVDMVFIDGDHSFEGCLGDTQAWIDHLRPGGVIVYHDFERDVWPDVAKAVDEAQANWKLQFMLRIDTLIAFVKPELSIIGSVRFDD